MLSMFKSRTSPWRKIVFGGEDQTPQEDYRTSVLDSINDYQTPELDRFAKHINELPNRTDYKPSVWRRIGASLAGFGVGLKDPGAGMELASAIAEQPYRRALTDWSNKASALKNSASLESNYMGRRNSYMNNLFDYDTKIKDIDRRTKRDAGDLTNKSREIDVREMDSETKAKVAELTEQRDKATDERERKRIDALIKRYESQSKNEANSISSRERIAANRDATSERNTKTRTEAVDKRTEAYKNRPTGSPFKPRAITPKLVKDSEVKALRDLMNSGQYEDLRKYIEVDDTGILVKKVSDPKTRDRINSFIGLIKTNSKSYYKNDKDEDDEFKLEEIQ